MARFERSVERNEAIRKIRLCGVEVVRCFLARAVKYWVDQAQLVLSDENIVEEMTYRVCTSIAAYRLVLFVPCIANNINIMLLSLGRIYRLLA